MPKKYIKKFIPSKEKLKKHKNLRFFGDLLHKDGIWLLNKFSTCRAMAIGVFCAFLPIPFQMVVAAAFAIFFSANLPISVALVWITNPITIPPVFYFCYKVGVYVLHLQPQIFKIELSWHWLISQINEIWQPLLFGSLLCGFFFSIISYYALKLIWRLSVIRQWKKRAFKRKNVIIDKL